jgi:hypothetical protein
MTPHDLKEKSSLISPIHSSNVKKKKKRYNIIPGKFGFGAGM